MIYFQKLIILILQNIIENIHNLRENILYMLSFEKLVRDEQQKVIEPILNDDNDQQKSYIVIL